MLGSVTGEEQIYTYYARGYMWRTQRVYRELTGQELPDAEAFKIGDRPEDLLREFGRQLLDSSVFGRLDLREWRLITVREHTARWQRLNPQEVIPEPESTARLTHRVRGDTCGSCGRPLAACSC